MANVSKLRVTKEYSKLNDALKGQIKLVYPEGYSQFLINYTNKEGKKVSALRFETDEKVYLIRMSVLEAEQLIEDDDDFDEDGMLKEKIKDEYEEKYAQVGYLDENDNYEGGNSEDKEDEDDD